MKVVLNGEPREFYDPEGTETVRGLLTAAGIEEERGLAVAINGQVVTRSDWDTVRIEDGALVEVLRAVQGG